MRLAAGRRTVPFEARRSIGNWGQNETVSAFGKHNLDSSTQCGTPATIEGIKDLLESLLSGTISPSAFCTCFEELWNFRIEKALVAPHLSDPLDCLFDEVVWFNPLPRGQWEYPRYRDELQIRAAVETALQSFSVDGNAY